MNKDIKQVIVVRKDLNMRKGKIAAQVAHASMEFLLNGASILDHEFTLGLRVVEKLWLLGLFSKIVVSVDSEEELRRLIGRAELARLRVHPIIDAGKTEFHGMPTLTCAAFGPDEAEKIDAITGGCKLL